MSDKKEFNHDELVVQNLLKDEHGRNYAWNKLQSLGVFENMFDNEPLVSAYNSGKRQAGLELMNDFKQYSMDNFLKMLKENM